MKRVLSDRTGIILSQVFIVLFMFFIPVSPTLKSIFFGCTMAALLFTPYFNQHIMYHFNTLWGRAGLALFLFILIACIWSPASYSQEASLLGKYSKLIYLPVLAVGFISPKTRIWTLNSYLAAMFITCVISILKSKNIHFIGDPGDPGEVFYNHISTGFMVAFASYLALLLASKANGWFRFVYLAMALLSSYQVLFINTGKTGYIVWFVLMALLLVQHLSFKNAAAGLVLLTGTFALVYTQSIMMHTAFDRLLFDVKALRENNKNTSLGFRVQFHNYAKSLFLEHPLAGIGTGGLKYRLIQDKPIPYWGYQFTDPHSQYWLILAEQGIIGLVLFFFFLGSLYLTSLKLKETRHLFPGLFIAFCIGCVSDTILCYSTAGYLLIMMSALCFGELLEKKVREESLVSRKRAGAFKPASAVSIEFC